MGLCVWTWDAGHGFVTLVAAFVASLILLLPAAFCIGLIVRYAELLWDAATWIGDRWRYRRRGVFPARAGMNRSSARFRGRLLPAPGTLSRPARTRMARRRYGPGRGRLRAVPGSPTYRFAR